MKNRAFEKCVWGTTFIFCMVMLSHGDASASTTKIIMEHMQNPFIYAFGMIASYIGAKIAGSATGQF